MDTLIEGYRRYRQSRWPQLRDLHAKLAQGQRPRTLVIACSDSRVDPTTIFDVPPGEFFVIRNVANLAPTYEEGGGYHGASAAIEFAVDVLEVETVLVLGHAQCGGCAAALRRETLRPDSFLNKWLELLEPAKARIIACEGPPETALEYESIKVTLENLMSFPFVAARVNAGKLALEGARYGVADGALEVLDTKTGLFSRIT